MTTTKASPPAPPPGHPDTEPVHKPRDTAEKAAHRARGTDATWWGVVAPPSLVLAQIGVNYAVVPWACRSGNVWLIHLISFACLAGTLLGAAVCFRAWAVLGRGGQETEAGTLEPARFVALGGLLFSASMALAILAVDLPTFILGPCD
jgi:hypothetical protein